MQMKLIIAVAALAAVSGTALADGATLFAEKTCVACHGKDGKKPLLPDYPKIAGQSKAYIEKQMRDIKSGARANGNSAAMKGVMEIVTDEDIPQIADYVSKLKP
jgi:cytochrome c